MSEPTETTDPQPPVDDSERVWEGSEEQYLKALDFLYVTGTPCWFELMIVDDAPPETQFRVKRATDVDEEDEVAS